MTSILTVKDLRTKSSGDRQKLLASLRKQLRELRFEKQAGSLTKVRQIRAIKKSIAKLLTVENEEQGK